MMLVDTNDLVGNLDIADRAGVTRAAVSNWIARHEDFPKPVAAFSNGKFKVFLWPEVEKWLSEPHTIVQTVTVTYTRRRIIQPRIVQHTAETCPGRPCSTDCDHVETR